MISQHWTFDSATAEPLAYQSLSETGARLRADCFMAWGHGAALAGGLAGIAGGMGLVASGTLSPLVIALLFTAPVGGMVMSGFLYMAAWRVDAGDLAMKAGSAQEPHKSSLPGHMSGHAIPHIPVKIHVAIA